MSVRTDTILSRIKNEHLRKAAGECLELGERFMMRKAQLEGGGVYTDMGRRKAVTDLLSKEFAPAFRKAQAPIVKAMDDVKRRRAALALPAPDPATSADRREIREHIKSLSPLKRLPFALLSQDQRIREAVLSAPDFLSGFSESDFNALHADTQAKLHGPALEEITALESAIAEASAAVQVAQGDIQRGSGIHDKDFSEILGKAGSNEVPWLMRDGDRVLVVRPGQGIYPQATADDIARGKFYANMQDYQQDHPHMQQRDQVA